MADEYASSEIDEIGRMVGGWLKQQRDLSMYCGRWSRSGLYGELPAADESAALRLVGRAL